MKKLIPIAAAVGYLAFGDWIAGLALAVLALAWVVLQPDEGPPVLALAATMQWVSVCVGFFYFLVTGRPMEATLRTDYRGMVLIGLGCVVAMVAGLAVGRYLIERMKPKEGLRPAHALTFKTLVLVYVVFTGSLALTGVSGIDFGGLQMAIVALTYLRLGLVYLIFRRLVGRGEWYYIGGMLVFEVILGITGYYAGFREPLIMAALAFLEFSIAGASAVGPASASWAARW